MIYKLYFPISLLSESTRRLQSPSNSSAFSST